MKKSILEIMVVIVILLSFTACEAQIKDAKTEEVKIYGNCDMCKETIENAGNIRKLAKVDWNADTKIATVTYDTKETNSDEILKRIALAGYDSDKFLAPDEAYLKLPDCCQYKREAKTEAKPSVSKMEMASTASAGKDQKTNLLQPVFDAYFALKDALVKTDGNVASAKAAALLTAINGVKMDQLEKNIHTVWMKDLNDLKEHSEHIADTKDIGHQRDHFMDLSKKMYDVMKISKTETPVYYQFCPMANDGKGAHWLSRESAVKNPYYGSKMLSCGKTVETIQ